MKNHSRHNFFSSLEVTINSQEIIIYPGGECDIPDRIQNLLSLDTVSSSVSADKCQQQQQSTCPG